MKPKIVECSAQVVSRRQTVCAKDFTDELKRRLLFVSSEMTFSRILQYPVSRSVLVVLL